MTAIIAAFSDNNIIPALFDGLERMQVEYGEYDEVSIAALMLGRIEQRYFVKNEQDFSSFLQKKTLTASLCLVSFRQKQAEQKSQVHLVATEQIALAYYGFIENIPDIREQLLQLGYKLDNLSPSELILLYIQRYLDIEMSVREATLTALKRLKGNFAIMALFAQEKTLVIAQQGAPLMFGIKNNDVYISSSSSALNGLVQPIMEIEEESLLILRSYEK